MPGKLALAGRNKILDRGIKIAEANLPSWLTQAAIEAIAYAGSLHAGDKANPHAVTKAQVGLGNVDNTSDAAKPVSTAMTTALAGKSNTGHGHTFADISGQLSTAQIPPLAISEPFVVASQAAMLALTAERGDVAIRTDLGRSYILAADAPGTLSNWKLLTAAGDVISVAGRTGTVVLAKGDVGLGNVDNTSDANKPVSTAQAAAFVFRWKTGAVYAVGDQVISPTNDVVTATVAHTAGATYDATKWSGFVRPFGHMGRTASFGNASANGTIVVMDAAQDLKGGMTFDNATDSLVIPLTGMYRVTVKPYLSGGSGYSGFAKAQRNLTDISGSFTNLWKANNADYMWTAYTVKGYNAGDKINLIVGSEAGAGSFWGTDGYNGCYLEVEYVGAL